jgi:Ca2+-binding EF-hand superfamily protein
MKLRSLAKHGSFYTLVFFASVANAQQPTPAQMQQIHAQLEGRFTSADTNKDGCVTKEETKGKMPRVYNNFERVDKDKKGCVTMDALKASMQDEIAARKGKTQ